jgi:hypothetical protein
MLILKVVFKIESRKSTYYSITRPFGKGGTDGCLYKARALIILACVAASEVRLNNSFRCRYRSLIWKNYMLVPNKRVKSCSNRKTK